MTRVRVSASYHFLIYLHPHSPSAEYRSAIFTHSADQLTVAQRVTEEVQAAHFTPKNKKIVTQIVEAGDWYDAEDYHQLYLFKHEDGYQCPTHRLWW